MQIFLLTSDLHTKCMYCIYRINRMYMIGPQMLTYTHKKHKTMPSFAPRDVWAWSIDMKSHDLIVLIYVAWSQIWYESDLGPHISVTRIRLKKWSDSCVHIAMKSIRSLSN